MLCYVRSVPLTSSYEPRSYRGRQFTLNVRTYDLLNWVLKTYVYDVLCLFIAMYLSCYVRFHVSQDRLPLFPLARNDNLIDKYWLVSGTDSSRISLEDWINYQISCNCYICIRSVNSIMYKCTTYISILSSHNNHQ